MTETKESTYCMIDVSNLSWRAWHSHEELKTSTGKPSGHVYGAVASLVWLLENPLKDYQTTMVFCYDGKSAKTRRLAVCPDYKGNREIRPFNPVFEVAEVLKLWDGIHIEQEGFEGDDAIAWAVKMRKGKLCIVYSGDKDFNALLQYPGCQQYSPNLKRFVTDEDLLKEFHLKNKPQAVPLAKALFGDSSDNIKGCKGLFKAHVAELLNDPAVTHPDDFYLLLDDFYQKVKESGQKGVMTKTTYEKLLACKEQIFTNYKVILPQLDFDTQSVTVVKNNSYNLKQKIMDYECPSLMAPINRVLGV
jgi:5'-3' exonuclease